MTRLALLICLLAVGAAPITAQKLPAFNAKDQPAAPDYSQEKYWTALPFRLDAADGLPKGETWVSDSLKEVDVFYVYPTIYQKGKTWCADVNNEKLNGKIDRLPVHFQATVFNASARVYAPRYRQGIITCYYDSVNGPKGLDFAYQDVRIAFQYYLDHYNHGRPIIIASHSQGTNHTLRLLREFFDGTTLSKQLVCAYVVGMGTDDRSYKVLRPCENATQTGCYVTWSSFKEGYDPGRDVLCGRVGINPITWTRDSAAVPATQTQGGILLKLTRKFDHSTSARLHNNYLWVKTKIPVVETWKVLHLVDYNLFWFDIRKNVADRVRAYLKK